MIAIVEMRVLHKMDVIVGNPFFQNIRPVGRDVARLHPVVGIFFHHMLRHGEGRVMRQQFADIGHFEVEGDFERVIVNRAHADLSTGSLPLFTSSAFLIG